MLKNSNDVYENCCMNEKCDLNWFEVFDVFEACCSLKFKLCKLLEKMTCWTVYCFIKKACVKCIVIEK
jgi:hypothetical protein